MKLHGDFSNLSTITSFSSARLDLDPETLAYLRQEVESMFQKIGKDEACLDLVQTKIREWPEIASHLASYAEDYKDANLRLNRHVSRMQHLTGRIQEVACKQFDLQQHQTRAAQKQKELEHFDLNNGYVSRSQFEDKNIYKKLKNARENIIRLRDLHEEKARKLQNEISEGRLSRQIQFLGPIGTKLRKEVKSILDGFLAILEKNLKSQEEALRFVDCIRAALRAV